ncbi:DNA adenine methylase [Tissierella carlieri]|uniref:site-specific DNA-methyltransferase (adenine-specific) n=1 Tax=Tissierella carlieri TaxID=689904 RepID=A0ABT1SEV4_9FIRM|nr:DNA adenine methylase [Tissierella carlieri]MCQ4925016.1 DNA adenine methylase [Tissierella carlieri]
MSVVTNLQCQFCGTSDKDCFEFDNLNRGFWCEICDGYNYFNSKREDNDRFTLILEDKSNRENTCYKSKIRFKKQLSLLRYPGGKSKLIDYIYSLINTDKINRFIEPFSGGASVGLSFLDAGIIKELILNDLDFGVYALFFIIKNDPHNLIYKINNHHPTHKDYFEAQKIIKSNYKGCDFLEAAWSLLIVNRLAYSGIYKANPLGGRNGSMGELLTRWNPKTLTNRILCIYNMSDKITVLNVDACELIEEEYWNEKSTIFIDPPYYRKGKDLYYCYFTKEEHIRLNVLLDNLYQGMPGADMILTYDNDRFVEGLYLYPEVQKVNRAYSI